MKAIDALRELATVTSGQWGMVTTAQAQKLGVSRLTLSRLAQGGHLERLSHSVYKVASAPSGEFDDLRAAWLSTEPGRLAWERLDDRPGNVVVSGESAASLHGIGNFWATRNEFTTPVRRQTQRPDIHFRTRELPAEDVTIREGLPVTTVERTLADLVETRTQLDHVGDSLRDAARKSHIDAKRLVQLLSPLAERNGHAKHNGMALFRQLQEAAHLELLGMAVQIPSRT